jgi:transcriptional regulator with PAS, ATPase and Fis domain
VSHKPGLIEAADGGSVFLDEIRELDAVMQAKLLTLLDARRFRRVGAVRPIEVDVRFIAATNRILLGEVKAGVFRDDLYYRLQVVALNLPPLRERGDDVFCSRSNLQYGSRMQTIDPDVADIFRRYPWPGNVRELENLLERICLLEDGERVRLAHLPDRIVRAVRSHARPITAGAAPASYHEATAAYQRQLIEQALQQAGGNLGHAAAALGLTRHALRHQMLKLKLQLS